MGHCNRTAARRLVSNEPLNFAGVENANRNMGMNESPTPYEIASMDDRTLVAMYFATSLEPKDTVVESLIAEMIKRDEAP